MESVKAGRRLIGPTHRVDERTRRLLEPNSPAEAIAERAHGAPKTMRKRIIRWATSGRGGHARLRHGEYLQARHSHSRRRSGFLLPPKSADTRSLVKKYLVSRKNGFQQNQSNDYSLEAQRTLSIDNIC